MPPPNDEAVSFETYLGELTDPRESLAVSHLVTLSNIGPDEASLLRDAWDELDFERRRDVIQALLDLAEDNVELNFDGAFFVALSDPHAELRRTAIRGLWEHEGRGLIEPLSTLLENDSDAGVRAEAALALGRFVLLGEHDHLRAGDRARVDGALRSTFEQADEVPEVRGRALESIGSRSEPWVQALIREAFASSERRLRLSAVHAMGRNCDSVWLAELIPELESEDPEMRFEAAGAAGSIADQSAVPHLLPLLDDDDSEAREAAIAALGEIGGDEAKEALEELLQDADSPVREAALAALAEVDFVEDPLGVKIRG